MKPVYALVLLAGGLLGWVWYDSLPDGGGAKPGMVAAFNADRTRLECHVWAEAAERLRDGKLKTAEAARDFVEQGFIAAQAKASEKLDEVEQEVAKQGRDFDPDALADLWESWANEL